MKSAQAHSPPAGDPVNGMASYDDAGSPTATSRRKVQSAALSDVRRSMESIAPLEYRKKQRESEGS